MGGVPPAAGAPVAGIRVLVPFDRSAASRRGLGVALRLAGVERRKSVVHPVFVVEVDRAFELDAYVPSLAAEGEASLAEAEAEAKQAKIKCEGWLLQARDAGPGIVEEAVNANVDLVVIGVGRATTIGDRGDAQTAHARTAANAVDLGRTADYVLSHAPCEVIVVREAAEAGNEPHTQRQPRRARGGGQ